MNFIEHKMSRLFYRERVNTINVRCTSDCKLSGYWGSRRAESDPCNELFIPEKALNTISE